jgi:Flp pilus assembly protein TadB
MTILLFGIGITFGLYFILAEYLKIPYLRTSKAVMNMGRDKKTLSTSIDTFIMDVAIKLSKIMYMDEYKRNRLNATLKAADIKMTPECYIAYAFVKAGVVLLSIIPCLLILPLISIVIVLLAVLVYFKEIRKADEKLKIKRESIETELPRFVSTIEQYLKSSRDVLSMLENYKRNAGSTMAQELNITCADMRSGGYEAALMRLEARINSPLLSDVVRGLIAIIRGDNGVLYFQMLSHDFKQMELRRLKAQAQKIPPKIRLLSFVMLLCFIATYLVIITVQIITSLNVMF